MEKYKKIIDTLSVREQLKVKEIMEHLLDESKIGCTIYDLRETILKIVEGIEYGFE